MKLSSSKKHHENESLTDAVEVDRQLYIGASWTVAATILFYTLLPLLVPESEWEYCSDVERQGTALASMAMVASTSFQLLPLLVRRKSGKRVSGMIVCTLVANGLALLTNLHFATQKTPIVYDPILGTRVFLMRWVEWTPLAAFLTFLSEAVDLPKDPRKCWVPLFISLLQALACVCGAFLAFAPNTSVWNLLLFVAFCTQAVMLDRLGSKYQAMRRTANGNTLSQTEDHERRTHAYELVNACRLTWVTLVVMFFVNGLRAQVFPPSHVLGNPAWTMFLETTFDVVAKVLYTKVIVDVHFDVFDSEKQGHRQLTELRRLMTVLWNSSSDVILITVRNGERMTAMLSPSFINFIGATGTEDEDSELGQLLSTHQTNNGMTSLLLEISKGTSEDGGDEVTARFVASDEVAGTDDMTLNQIGFIPIDSSAHVVKMARTLVELSQNNDQGDEEHQQRLEYKTRGKPSRTVGHSFIKPSGEECRCEIIVNNHSQTSMAAVVRDVTERSQRLEAEQEAHQQVLARQRDAHAVNSFTRHEVKNGLLASIELCDTLRSSIDDLNIQHQRFLLAAGMVDDSSRMEMPPSPSARMDIPPSPPARMDMPPSPPARMDMPPSPPGRFRRGNSYLIESSSSSDCDMLGTEETRAASGALSELNSNLHKILETVLSESMVRDVIHEIYQPRLERLDLQSVLLSCGVGKDPHFPLVTESGPLPYVSSDPQLLKYIMRNAISNACKYGKPSGVVETHLRYDFNEGKLHMDIINEPGIGHEMLLAMGAEASKAVFEQGARLHSKIEASEQRATSGDAAWIMKKCATVMGGSCDIRFEQHRTVFAFSCAASAVVVEKTLSSEDFKVPPDTWGIGIDDAKIQRKLLKQAMTYIGVQESHRIITGKTPNEVYDIEDKIRTTLEGNPKSKLFVLVDENLDFRHSMKKDVVISGSRLMEDILQRLPPSMEERTLVLVRSANDSAEDVAEYCSRAHGFFPKAPLQPEGVCGIVAPLWADRFSERPTNSMETGRIQRKESIVLSAADLQHSLALVDIAVEDLSIGLASWPQVWSALHSLQGDLMVVGVGGGNKDAQVFREAIISISQMRGQIQPVDFNETWPTIRRSVQSAIRWW